MPTINAQLKIISAILGHPRGFRKLGNGSDFLGICMYPSFHVGEELYGYFGKLTFVVECYTSFLEAVEGSPNTLVVFFLSTPWKKYHLSLQDLYLSPCRIWDIVR